MENKDETTEVINIVINRVVKLHSFESKCNSYIFYSFYNNYTFVFDV